MSVCAILSGHGILIANALLSTTVILTAHAIGLLSGALVFSSIVPYAIRAYSGKIRPVPTSWSLWSFIGLAILLTYKSSGASTNIWPAVFGFTNPTLITVLSVLRHNEWKRPSLGDKLCFVLGVIAMILWLLLRRSAELSRYALLVAIAADVCAAIPTLRFVWSEPEADRPLAWFIFGCGYFLVLFGLPQNTLAAWGLPVYMTAVSWAIALPLALYRLRTHVPWTEWM